MSANERALRTFLLQIVFTILSSSYLAYIDVPLGPGKLIAVVINILFYIVVRYYYQYRYCYRKLLKYEALVENLDDYLSNKKKPVYDDDPIETSKVEETIATEKQTSEGARYTVNEALISTHISAACFDVMEYKCWELFKDYAKLFGITFDEDDIDFRIAKEIQELILSFTEELGARLITEEENEM